MKESVIVQSEDEPKGFESDAKEPTTQEEDGPSIPRPSKIFQVMELRFCE